MPKKHSKSHFQDAWKEKNDDGGQPVRPWLREVANNPCAAFCCLCYKNFDISSMGWAAVVQHAKGKLHTSNSKEKLKANCVTDYFVKQNPAVCDTKKDETEEKEKQTPVPSTSSASKPMKEHLLLADAVTKAEALWSMKVANSNFSFASCDDLPELFQEMFPDSVIARQFTLGASKVSYTLSHGLGPHFSTKLCDDVRDSSTYFTLFFDETTTTQNRKQFDVLIRFYSESRGEVVTHFLNAFFMGHSKGEDVVSKMVEMLKALKLPLSRVLSVSSDGPNVNKTIKRKLESAIQESGGKGLVDVGFCSIHVVHNSFRKGLIEFGSDVEAVIIDTFYFFRKSPCRKEDFIELLMELDMKVQSFLKHGQTRWLTLIPAIVRFRELLPALQTYIKSLSSDKSFEKLDRYRSLNIKLAKSDLLLVQIHFLESLQPIFEEFLRGMQTTGPRVHCLHSAMVDVLTKLALRLLKPSSVTGCPTEWKFDKNQLDDKYLQIGEETKAAIQKLKSEKDRKFCYLKMRQFLEVVLVYLQKNLPLGNKLLKSLHCLHPNQRKNGRSVEAIKYVASKMPGIQTQEVSSVVDEYKMYQLEKNIPEEQGDSDGMMPRVDHYWKNVFGIQTSDGYPKYPTLARVVKCALTLSHGQADNERSLSINKNLLRADRTGLSDEAINGCRITKDAVHMYGKEHQVSVDQSMIQACRTAHKMHKQHKEEERKKEQEKKKQVEEMEKEKRKRQEQQEKLKRQVKDLEQEKKELDKESENLEEKIKYNKTLMTEAHERMETAIKENNSCAMSTAHKLSKVALDESNELQQKASALGKRKSDVIEKLQKAVKRAKLFD